MTIALTALLTASTTCLLARLMVLHNAREDVQLALLTCAQWCGFLACVLGVGYWLGQR